ncbi:hypothetical protein [Photobacterium leiognathi]|uniref:hypothetical protein n=1 Tax=Photobacterium leiognathi TaxID=553611 RepID=UPI000208806C|nr:hypothetical protein [Photobacterium leiognathi]PSW48357.1 hypothetical protein CTM83_20200 [Photobacterium leiognathi subsp. mandapamensis]GAA03207.1 putative uncharacterized protein [Photobacterium leiognathi subsp. mandapamensis svers.1.1.]
MDNAALINQSSGEFEYYTPIEYVEPARKLMGGIDLDPASCDIANKVVRATTIYTKEDNGLSKPLYGRVFMNHPFHRGEKACPSERSRCKKKTCIKRGHHIDKDIPSNFDWITHLVDAYEQGLVKEAVCVTFANMSEIWMKKLLRYPQLFPDGRIHYRLPTGDIADSATKGSVVTYLGTDIQKFKRCFGHLGEIKVRV